MKRAIYPLLFVALLLSVACNRSANAFDTDLFDFTGVITGIQTSFSGPPVSMGVSIGDPFFGFIGFDEGEGLGFPETVQNPDGSVSYMFVHFNLEVPSILHGGGDMGAGRAELTVFPDGSHVVEGGGGHALSFDLAFFHLARSGDVSFEIVGASLGAFEGGNPDESVVMDFTGSLVSASGTTVPEAGGTILLLALSLAALLLPIVGGYSPVLTARYRTNAFRAQ